MKRSRSKGGVKEALPHFKYHPDPLGTGSIARSRKKCGVCGRARGFIYESVPYGVSCPSAICPWCIADGSARNKFKVEFTPPENIGDYGRWDKVPRRVVAEVAFRTPGFSAWQQERWFTHCGDAAEFLGPMGKKELEALGSEAITVIRDESGYNSKQWKLYYQRLDRNYNATAYLFRCRYCGTLGGYSDCD